MRNITKILLLVVVAFVVYLLWPRTGDLKAFNPGELAGLEVQKWQAQKRGKGFDTLMARFKIYSSQYHFSPIAAFRIAQNEGAALAHLKLSAQEGADPAEENHALLALTEKYTAIKKQTKVAIDADAMAREEFSLLTLEMAGAAANDEAAPLAQILAGLYGGQPGDFADVTTNLVAARALIFNDAAASAVANPAATAQATAKEAYGLLKEVATTPPASPANP
jgi:hypothetical protein